MVVLDDRELVGGEPVVVGGPLEVDDPRLGAPDRAAVAVLHRHAVDQHAVEGAVAGFERCARGTDQLAEGVVECGPREVGVEAGERASEPRGKHDFAVLRPFGHRAVGGNVGAVGDIPIEAEQPVEGRVFDLRLGNTKCQRSAQHCSIDGKSFIAGWRLLPSRPVTHINLIVLRPPKMAKQWTGSVTFALSRRTPRHRAANVMRHRDHPAQVSVSGV